MSISPRTHTEIIRHAEFEFVIRRHTLVGKVLEVGGGTGFQAALISEVASECVSIDIDPNPESIFPVTIYDGRTFPFEDDVFDVIFSSNVLEHVVDLDHLLGECARVLKPGGAMIHVVPSVWWRLWTTLSYYPALPKIIWGNVQTLRRIDASESSPPNTLETRHQTAKDKSTAPALSGALGLIVRRFKLKWFRSILLSPRHGERGNELTEAFYFRASWWRSLFERNGWTVTDAAPCELFYTGNILLGRALTVRWRSVLSTVLGSSTHVFRLTKGSGATSGEP